MAKGFCRKKNHLWLEISSSKIKRTEIRGKIKYSDHKANKKYIYIFDLTVLF